MAMILRNFVLLSSFDLQIKVVLNTSRLIDAKNVISVCH